VGDREGRRRVERDREERPRGDREGDRATRDRHLHELEEQVVALRKRLEALEAENDELREKNARLKRALRELIDD
jgi:hypothetical protein